MVQTKNNNKKATNSLQTNINTFWGHEAACYQSVQKALRALPNPSKPQAPKASSLSKPPRKTCAPHVLQSKQFPCPTLRTAGLTNSVKHTPGLPQPGLPQRSPAQPGTNTALTKTSPHPEYTAQTLHSWHNTGPSNIPTHLGTQEQALT